MTENKLYTGQVSVPDVRRSTGTERLSTAKSICYQSDKAGYHSRLRWSQLDNFVIVL